MIPLSCEYKWKPSSDDASAHAEKNRISTEGKLKNRLWVKKSEYFLTVELNEWAAFQLMSIHMVHPNGCINSQED